MRVNRGLRQIHYRVCRVAVVAMCCVLSRCSVLQSAAPPFASVPCDSVLQRVVVLSCSVWQSAAPPFASAPCCSVLQRVAVLSCSVFRSAAPPFASVPCCSVLQCVAVLSCRVLQSAAPPFASVPCCSVLQCVTVLWLAAHPCAQSTRRVFKNPFFAQEKYYDTTTSCVTTLPLSYVNKCASSLRRVGALPLIPPLHSSRHHYHNMYIYV